MLDVMYLCVGSIDFPSLRFWNFSDSLVFFVFVFIPYLIRYFQENNHMGLESEDSLLLIIIKWIAMIFLCL